MSRSCGSMMGPEKGAVAATVCIVWGVSHMTNLFSTEVA